MIESDADVAVIGAGPGGLAAACEARRWGLSVALIDEQAAPGGQIYRNIGGATNRARDILGADYNVGSSLAEEFLASGSRYINGASVWNLSSDGKVDFTRLGQAERISGSAAVIATGAMERPFPIRGWTLPGVMGAGAAQIMLKAAGATPGLPPVLVGCGPLLYLLAWQYLRAGAYIKAVVDTTESSGYLRALRHAGGALFGYKDLAKGLMLLRALRAQNVLTYHGCTRITIEGDATAKAVTFRHRGHRVRLDAGLVLLHQGVVPNTQLSWSIGADHVWSDQQLCWQPVTDSYGKIAATDIYVVGDSRGIVGAQASATQGRLAALAIAECRGLANGALIARRRELETVLKRQTAIRPFLDALYRPLDENRIPAGEGTIVCRCEEVTAGQIRDYVALGCLGPNQTKAFSRCGMGPCQGRFCGLTVTEMIARARGVDPTDVGYYRVRPPIKPVTLGELGAVRDFFGEPAKVSVEEETV